MARSIWVIAEVADGKLSRITTEVATAARGIAEQAGRDVVGVVVGADPGKPAEELARFVPRVLSVADLLTDSIRKIFTDESVSEIFAGENQLF